MYTRRVPAAVHIQSSNNAEQGDDAPLLFPSNSNDSFRSVYAGFLDVIFYSHGNGNGNVQRLRHSQNAVPTRLSNKFRGPSQQQLPHQPQPQPSLPSSPRHQRLCEAQQEFEHLRLIKRDLRQLPQPTFARNITLGLERGQLRRRGKSQSRACLETHREMSSRWGLKSQLERPTPAVKLKAQTRQVTPQASPRMLSRHPSSTVRHYVQSEQLRSLLERKQPVLLGSSTAQGIGGRTTSRLSRCFVPLIQHEVSPYAQMHIDLPIVHMTPIRKRKLRRTRLQQVKMKIQAQLHLELAQEVYNLSSLHKRKGIDCRSKSKKAYTARNSPRNSPQLSRIPDIATNQ